MEKKGIKVAVQNRKAFHDYFVEERYEAGIELFGTEVKSIRGGQANLKDAFCVAKDGEIYAYQLALTLYSFLHTHYIIITLNFIVYHNSPVVNIS